MGGGGEGKTWAFDYFLCEGVGNLTFAWKGWERLNRKCQVSNDFFSGAEVANNFKQVFGREFKEI